MEHKIVEKEAFTVVGMKYTGAPASPEIPKLWEKYLLREDEIQNRASMESFGIMGRYDQATNTFDYLAGLPVTSTENVPDGMDIWSLDGGKYAVFTTCLKTLQEDMSMIYNKALPESGYTAADSPAFELYDEDFRGEEDDPLYVYIPIQE